MKHNDIWEIAAKALTFKPRYVKVNYNEIDRLKNDMELVGVESFFENTKDYNIGIKNEVLKELVANSINYCYWYGTSNLRPNGCSSTKMYELVEMVFKKKDRPFDKQMEHLMELLSINMFPLLEERINHLSQLCNGKAERFVDYVVDKKANLDLIARYFPGFASDIFMKRASLFFIQLYRKFGWFADMELPVPADYQVPKILKYYRCIEYSPELEEIIYENQLIPKGSIQEIQIRAATIIACGTLSSDLNWHIGDVDTFLWTRRKEIDENFHLTITTDY